MNRKTHTLKLGKIDYNGSGRKNCMAEIEWSLEDGRFSMSAGIWNARGTDYTCCGQCVDTVAAYFPRNKKVQRMLRVWLDWHLNDMTAGSPAQTEWLKAHPRPDAERGDHYSWACGALRAAGLNPDPGYMHGGKPYAYGSAWLSRGIPSDILAEIDSWSNEPA